MKRVIIFFNGDLSGLQNARQYIVPGDYILCADGGIRHAFALGLTPDCVLGDMDSVSKSTLNKIKRLGIQVLEYSKEKDETDGELVMQKALSLDYTSLILFGLLGTRIDQVITNINALEYLQKPDSDVLLVEGNQEIRLITDTIILKGKKGDLVSLIPFKADATGVSTKRLAYPLRHETLRFGYSRGISNVFTNATAEIVLHKGRLLVVHTRVK